MNTSDKPTLSEADDQLMDALLSEFADRGPGADEKFLTGVEAALDAGEHLETVPAPTRKTSRSSKPFWFAAGIAAGLVLALVASRLIDPRPTAPSRTVVSAAVVPTDPTPVVSTPFTGIISVGHDSSIYHRGVSFPGDNGQTLSSLDIGARYQNITRIDPNQSPIESLGGGEALAYSGDIVIHAGGTIIANGESSGGSIGVAGSGMVLGDGTISATGANGAGGTSDITLTDEVVIAGSISASGGTGGTIDLSGNNILISEGGGIGADDFPIKRFGVRIGDGHALAVQNTGEVRATGAGIVSGQGILPASPTGGAGGTITVTAGETITATTGEPYAQIGHGGRGSDAAVAPASIADPPHAGHGQVAPGGVDKFGTEYLPAELPGSVRLAKKASINKPDEGKATGIEVGRTRNAAIAADASKWETKEAKPAAADFAEDPLAGKREAPPTDRERYDTLVDNEFLSPMTDPLSTFSIDVDTASYTNLRRMLRDGSPIPKDAIRIEEMINYFDYDYPQPEGDNPFGLALEAAECPWAENHQLLRVGIQGKTMNREERPPANLVFLLDVSGSMNDSRKLPLLKQSMSILVEELGPDDCVSIVVYAGAEGLALPATRGDDHETILKALNNLGAGGSTNGGAGIKLAYKLARENFKQEGVNRVLLCTDGDFNVGLSGQGDLVELVTKEAKSGAFLSVLGFGTGNINDSMLEAITNDGNGTYYYIDSDNEARKVFLEDIMGTLVTIAKDVKIQIEFNPAKVQSYRLIGYANRMLETEDFEDDTVDTGEIGAGHRVTALYEIVPADVELDEAAKPREEPELEFQRPAPALVPSDKLAILKLRYKQPDGDVSTEIRSAVSKPERDWQATSDDFQFAAGVALFGMLLRDSEYAGQGTFAEALELATEGTVADPLGRRAEFQELVRTAIERFTQKGANNDDVSGGASISVKF